MKLKLIVFFFVALLIFQPFLIMSQMVGAETSATGTQVTPDLYVGVDIAYQNITLIEQLIDQISQYSNLIIIGCTGITNNTASLNEVCQYIYNKNMSFIVYPEGPGYPSQQWVQTAESQYGNRFLGLYVLDEEGGKQLDARPFSPVQSANNITFTDAENQFVSTYSNYLDYFKGQTYSPTLFTSDYALYWFDYEAGWDTVFAEFGWNYSQQLNVALCRGAATVQNKDWGVMITWTYTQPPYIESGPKLYNDMVLAYENGAKYIVIFDSNENYTQSILQPQHLQAMQEFWQYVQNNPRKPIPVNERTAYVLPEAYAYGFRGGQDKIWGVWQADTLSVDISMSVYTLLQMDNTYLDIVYPNPQQPISSLGYRYVVYWNDTRLIPEVPDAPPIPVQTPTPTPTPTPSLSPSILPSPTSSAAFSPSPSPPSTGQATPPSEPSDGISLPIGYVYAIAIGIIAGVAVSIAVLEKRR